jgi:hypothetical protein
LLAPDDIGAYCLDKENEPKETPIKELKCWLDIYFQGKKPDFEPPIHKERLFKL